ncbi:acyltransferase family protein [Limobrevibacterium gyesilva]|uniref:Acyltransferase n=1 Tax=Limobrevibacterium gyesilva TaxID=2991712 RepID=A0AA42CJI3_9PROT|nr:acyltransferase [Limobrevibacterium gyesilva]
MNASGSEYQYINCVRGYAVLMVITTHVTSAFPDLPYPLHRHTIMGWHGVQMFFLASCVTLLMSWNAERRRNGRADAGSFFIRRIFRIAPAYYLSGILYFLLAPPPGGFDVWQALASATFVNAWHPQLMPTVENGWSVVPGGWSISVEFAFYFLFPVYAALATSLRRACWAFLAAVIAGAVLNQAALRMLSPANTPESVANFLFFWFPNQMSVFALGGVLYYAIGRITTGDGVPGRIAARYGTPIALLSVILFLGLAYLPVGRFVGAYPILPSTLAASLVMALFILSLSFDRGPFVNRYAAAFGTVSFSAYLLHFAVLEFVAAFPEVFQTRATGVRALLAFPVVWLVVAAVTFVLSWSTYRAIELPMINAGKALIRMRRARLVLVRPDAS